ncbi:hypothetical protein [Actinoplanes teichomyceticus]|uniref:Uncharacterized protein n=1 Tax=Actinoplanes teichomyceticus TaxID=1867 RepID=A0A561VLH5_ACTTI|nr:hypothetical protein [Actinoplanes teichomyceticus]TWG12465.1 hypothetical protein FHX34_105332 [Actinoplanes teichomyceticus]GIF13829.1 hypothetical protein Ate01nite_38610 [Actinoplanes teichomyceticus]
MAIVVLLWLAAIATAVWALWPASAPVADSPEPAVTPEPASLEGVLVAQLIRREITPAQYRHALGRLAERDDQRHPMSVPRDGA